MTLLAYSFAYCLNTVASSSSICDVSLYLHLVANKCTHVLSLLLPGTEGVLMVETLISCLYRLSRAVRPFAPCKHVYVATCAHSADAGTRNKTMTDCLAGRSFSVTNRATLTSMLDRCA